MIELSNSNPGLFWFHMRLVQTSFETIINFGAEYI